jgi:hypothetical protein
VVDFLGSEPLRRNRHKQVAAAIGGAIAFLLLILGLNSLFSPKLKLKMIQPNQVVGDSAAPTLQAPATAKPPVMTASPAATQEINPDQAGTKSHLDESKASPETTVPLAVPVAPAKKPAAPAQTKAEKPPAKTEKNVHKTVHATEAKAVKSETSPKLVATLDQEIPARKKADALTRQGHRAIVKKVKRGNKTVYQVWLTAAAATPAKLPVPAAKPKVVDKTSAANHK